MAMLVSGGLWASDLQNVIAATTFGQPLCSYLCKIERIA